MITYDKQTIFKLKITCNEILDQNVKLCLQKIDSIILSNKRVGGHSFAKLGLLPTGAGPDQSDYVAGLSDSRPRLPDVCVDRESSETDFPGYKFLAISKVSIMFSVFISV